MQKTIDNLLNTVVLAELFWKKATTLLDCVPSRIRHCSYISSVRPVVSSSPAHTQDVFSGKIIPFQKYSLLLTAVTQFSPKL